MSKRLEAAWLTTGIIVAGLLWGSGIDHIGLLGLCAMLGATWAAMMTALVAQARADKERARAEQLEAMLRELTPADD